MAARTRLAGGGLAPRNRRPAPHRAAIAADAVVHREVLSLRPPTSEPGRGEQRWQRGSGNEQHPVVRGLGEARPQHERIGGFGGDVARKVDGPDLARQARLGGRRDLWARRVLVGRRCVPACANPGRCRQGARGEHRQDDHRAPRRGGAREPARRRRGACPSDDDFAVPVAGGRTGARGARGIQPGASRDDGPRLWDGRLEQAPIARRPRRFRPSTDHVVVILCPLCLPMRVLPQWRRTRSGSAPVRRLTLGTRLAEIRSRRGDSGARPSDGAPFFRARACNPPPFAAELWRVKWRLAWQDVSR
mmetsp:Transcript_22984/g.66581  ORF Transcript_22984/g.66581 Transcript_22984/m.66581 type:complete len:304 (+) Transcript_22984:1223-2134(+)